MADTEPLISDGAAGSLSAQFDLYSFSGLFVPSLFFHYCQWNQMKHKLVAVVL